MVKMTESLPPELNPAWALRMTASRRRSGFTPPYIRAWMPFLALDTRRFSHASGTLHAMGLQTGLLWPEPHWTGGAEQGEVSGLVVESTGRPGDTEAPITADLRTESTGRHDPPLALALALRQVKHDGGHGTGITEAPIKTAGLKPEILGRYDPPFALALALRQVKHGGGHGTGITEASIKTADLKPEFLGRHDPPLALALVLKQVRRGGGHGTGTSEQDRVNRASREMLTPIVRIMPFSARPASSIVPGLKNAEKVATGRSSVVSHSGINRRSSESVLMFSQNSILPSSSGGGKEVFEAEAMGFHGNFLPTRTLPRWGEWDSTDGQSPMPHPLVMGHPWGLPDSLPEHEADVSREMINRDPVRTNGLSLMADTISREVKQEVVSVLKLRENETPPRPSPPAVAANAKTENRISDGIAMQFMRKMHSLAKEERFRMGLLR